MQTYLHYFFEYVVFFLVIIPVINELVFLFYPAAIIKLRAILQEDNAAARKTWVAQLAGASFVVAICGIFTSQGLLFWLYFLTAFAVLWIQIRKPTLKTNPWFIRLDGLICLVILSMILLGRFYFHQPFINAIILWIGSPPEEATEVILRAS